MAERDSSVPGGEPPSTSATRVAVQVDDEQSIAVDHARIKEVAREAAEAEGAWGDICVYLVEPDVMAETNRTHMGEDGPTDVLSFPIDGKTSEPAPDGGPPIIGDLVLCPAVAQEQAAEGLSAELELLVTHGVLHLLGYDHDTEEAAARMRRREYELIGRSGAQA